MFEIDTRRTNNLLLFFHEPPRTFVVEDIFGMDVLQLPKVDGSNQIKKTLHGNFFLSNSGSRLHQGADQHQDGQGDANSATEAFKGMF